MHGRGLTQNRGAGPESRLVHVGKATTGLPPGKRCYERLSHPANRPKVGRLTRKRQRGEMQIDTAPVSYTQCPMHIPFRKPEQLILSLV